MDKIEQKIKNQEVKEWEISTLQDKLENEKCGEKWEKYPYLQDILDMYSPTHYIGKQYYTIKEMEVSSFGRVRVKYDNKNEYVILKQDDYIEGGYLRLSEFPGFGYVYRLVADTWLEKTSNRNIVHHIDNDGYNNKVENLIWVSAEEHAKIHGIKK